MSSKRPRILLIGAGAFGSRHLMSLLRLEKQGVLELAGVVVGTKKSQERLQRASKVPIHLGFSLPLLKGVDAVDIVTPPETHAELILQCLPLTHVLVEKPMAVTEAEAQAVERVAKKFPHVLMVGHIFRFHPAIMHLKKLVAESRVRPQSVECSFINPSIVDSGRDVALEMLHPFDMIDYVFGGLPKRTYVDDKGRLKIVSLEYPRGLHALIKHGWAGSGKRRMLKVCYANRHIECDLIGNTLTVVRDGRIEKKIDFSGQMEPLETELRTFVGAMRSSRTVYPDATVGRRIVSIALSRQAKRPASLRRKKVAIIGAGIFGANCAIELAPHYDVTVFDKNDTIFSEASHINQYRHHWGYHYPRSQGTVDDIRRSISDFEERYGQAIITEFPTYYSVAKKGSKTSSKDFKAFCKRNKLPFTLESPGPRFINEKKISLCMKTFEPIYDYAKLKQLTELLLKKSGVTMKLGHEVIGATIEKDGRKTLRITHGAVVSEDQFDYVISATYVRHNAFCTWLGLPKKLIRIDLVEALWIKLDIPKISLAVMDGPFTNMVPMGEPGMFTLVHIKESILRRFVPQNGLVPPDIFGSTRESRAARIIAKSMEWFPILKEAKIVDIKYVLRGVNANREYDDARMSGITEHGFGCFSILGGKLVNAVTTAKQIAQLESFMQIGTPSVIPQISRISRVSVKTADA